MTRHLNGVKYPLSQEDLHNVVERVEERFAKSMIIPAGAGAVVVEVVPSKVGLAVTVCDTDCRCESCIHTMLDRMIVNSEKALKDMEVSLGQTEEIAEINYVG